MREVFLVEVYLRNEDLNGDIVEQLFSRECSEKENCRKENIKIRCQWQGLRNRAKNPLKDPVGMSA
jgi:hypothetical protein